MTKLAAARAVRSPTHPLALLFGGAGIVSALECIVLIGFIEGVEILL
jgi:hypothetical protein